MYKIRYYFLMLTLLSVHLSFGQRPQAVRAKIDPTGISIRTLNLSGLKPGSAAKAQTRAYQNDDPVAEKTRSAYLADNGYRNRKTVFIAHLLAD